MLEPYIYVFVRQDIPHADQIVQVGHASLEAGKEFSHPEGTNMVLIGVQDLAALTDVAHKLHKADISHVMFDEPDDDMGYTCIATQPIYGKQRKHFRKYELWRP